MSEHRVADISFSDGVVECQCGAVMRADNLPDAFNTHRVSEGLKKGDRITAGASRYENTPWRAKGAMAIRRMV